MDTLQHKLQHISSYTGKLLRSKFGRGPEACHAMVGHSFLLLRIDGFISPMEEVLLQQGHRENVVAARSIVMSSILAELKGVIQASLEIDVVRCYNDWNLPNNSGVICAVLDRTFPTDEPGSTGEQPDIGLLEQEVSRLSILVQKEPEQVRTYRINDNVYIVIRGGILVPIEKALIEKGYGQALRDTKDELEKVYFHRNGRFEDLFRRPVADIFFDWSFREDEGFICFCLDHHNR